VGEGRAPLGAKGPGLVNQKKKTGHKRGGDHRKIRSTLWVIYRTRYDKGGTKGKDNEKGKPCRGDLAQAPRYWGERSKKKKVFPEKMKKKQPSHSTDGKKVMFRR